MKTSLVRSIVLAAGFVFGSLSAVAASAPNEATVLKVTGTATATMPGGAPQTLRVGDKIQQGATVNTAAGAEIHIQPFSGSISTIKENSSVSLDKLALDTNNAGRLTKQTALLSLKSGNVVSTIDPKNRDINDYGVSTPKGVAAARGTSLTVITDATNNVTVTANADSVIFTDNVTGQSVTIAQGQVTYTPVGSTVQVTVPISQVANVPSVAAAVNAGVTAMSSVIAGNLGGLSAGALENLTSKVVAVAAAALPAQAAAITSQVVTAIASSSGGGASNQQVSNLVASVVAAATTAAPEQAQAIAVQTVQTLNTNASGSSAAAVSNAISAAVSAAVAAAPAGTSAALVDAVQTAVPTQTTNITTGVQNAPVPQATKDAAISEIATNTGRTADALKGDAAANTTVAPPAPTAISNGQGSTTPTVDTSTGPTPPTTPPTNNNNQENTTVTPGGV